MAIVEKTTPEAFEKILEYIKREINNLEPNKIISTRIEPSPLGEDVQSITIEYITK